MVDLASDVIHYTRKGHRLCFELIQETCFWFRVHVQGALVSLTVRHPTDVPSTHYRSWGVPVVFASVDDFPTFPECSETSSLYARCLCFCEVKAEHSFKVFLDSFEMTTIKSYFRKYRYVIPIHTNANANAGTIFENTK